MAADNNPTPDVETALASLNSESEEEQAGFLQAVATGEVLLPQVQGSEQPGADEGQEAQGVQLPFIEQEGTRYVLAFSSQQRLTDSGIDAEQTASVSGAELAMAWPQDEELWLAINPGSEEGVALPPDAVRALPSLASGS